MPPRHGHCKWPSDNAGQELPLAPRPLHELQHLSATIFRAARLGLGRWKSNVEDKLRTLDDIYRFAVEQTGMTRLASGPIDNNRLVLWRNVLQLIAAHPWFGWGLGELDYAHYATLSGETLRPATITAFMNSISLSPANGRGWL